MVWSPTLWPPTYVVIFFLQLKRKTPEIFGRYQFAGMEGGKPYYQVMPSDGDGYGDGDGDGGEILLQSLFR